MLLQRLLPKSTPSSLLLTKRRTTYFLLHRPPHHTITTPGIITAIMTIHMQGRCVCKKLQYSLDLDSPEDARTTLCHCHSCRRAFGTNYGLTAKVPLSAFKYESGTPRKHKQENGVTREFCEECGAYICEYGEEAADKFRYVMWGSLDEPEKVPPKGEFFCKSRTEWMPELQGVFHKKEIKE